MGRCVAFLHFGDGVAFCISKVATGEDVIGVVGRGFLEGRRNCLEGAGTLDFFGGERSGIQSASLLGTKKSQGSFELGVGKRL